MWYLIVSIPGLCIHAYFKNLSVYERVWAVFGQAYRRLTFFISSTPVLSACTVESLSLLNLFLYLNCIYYDMRHRYVMNVICPCSFVTLPYITYKYTEQQKKRILCIFVIVYELGFKY